VWFSIFFLHRRETDGPAAVRGVFRIGGGSTTPATPAQLTRISGRTHVRGVVVRHGRQVVGLCGWRGSRVQVHVLRQAVRHELEPENAPPRAHGREAVRVPPVRGHVQAESTPAQTPVLGAQERHIARHQRRRPGSRGRVQLLLLSDDVRHAPAAGPPLFRAAQQPVAHQEPKRLTIPTTIILTFFLLWRIFVLSRRRFL